MDFSSLTSSDVQLNYTTSVMPTSGTSSINIDIPVSGSRAGFNPALSLNYKSSSSNSTFGIGWSMSGISFIGLDISEGLPNYDGADNYAFNGSNTLLPTLKKKNGNWEQRVEEKIDYWIFYFRDKVEGSFTRYEKWVKKSDNSIHWRIRSKSGVISIYGMDQTKNTRIYDPENTVKEFIWLLESQYDSNGNAIIYKYKSENNEGIDSLSSFEINRLKKFNLSSFSQKYPEKILYGNTKHLSPDSNIPAGNKWMFEIVFDYGNFPDKPYNNSVATKKWITRDDPFSIYGAGFEIRTYRLCRRILMYHNFEELSSQASLVGSVNLNYNESATGTTLKSIFYTGIRKNIVLNNYSEKSLPAILFSYSIPTVGNSFNNIVKTTNENIPHGFNNVNTRFVDLFGEGIPGILCEKNEAWYYKSNLGKGEFGKQETVISKPSHLPGSLMLGDFDQNGNINYFSFNGQTAGYYEYDSGSEKWSGFNTFENTPNVTNAKYMDVNSDGLTDLVVEKEDKILCYPFKGKKGFDKPYEFSKPVSKGTNYAPKIGNDLELDYFLADMTGDGLPDQVKINNGNVVYYPNLGNGHFDEGIYMENAPQIDFENKFDASRIRLYDLDGSGTSDIIYIGNGEIRYWYNASGNKFVDGGVIGNTPYIDNIDSAIVLDFLNTGVPCLVWSNSFNHLQYSSIQYLELTNGIKPRLLESVSNNMGQEVKFTYNSSASHYLRDKISLQPWITKIPSHFTVVDKKEVIDHITNSRLVSLYKYRDGHYDGEKRRFQTFGLVEQYDTESFLNSNSIDKKDYSEPKCIKTWFHSGIYGENSKYIDKFYNEDQSIQLLEFQSFESFNIIESEEFSDAYRNLSGNVVRQELYAVDDKGEAELHPYSVSQYSYKVRKLQPKTEKNPASFYAYQCEAVSHSYEKNKTDPKISHHMTLEVTEYGDIEKDINIFYARREGVPARLASQEKDFITLSTNNYTHINTEERYEAGILYEWKDYEVKGIDRTVNELFNYDVIVGKLNNLIDNSMEYDQILNEVQEKAKLNSWNRSYFWNDDFTDVLPLGNIGKQIFSHHEESACFNDALVNNVYTGKVSTQMLSNSMMGNYIKNDNYWWQKTAINFFHGKDRFYSLEKAKAVNDAITSYTYDKYFLNVIEIKDHMGNITKGEIDYNLVEPYRLIDINDNVSEVLYDELGITISSFSQGSVLDDTETKQLYGSGKLLDYQRRGDESFSNILNEPEKYLQTANNFYFYELDTWEKERKPLKTISISREDLVHDGKGNVSVNSNIQLSFSYYDGFSRTIQSKRIVEPGQAIKRAADGTVEIEASGVPVLTHSNRRLLVSGHVIYNNKQQPIRQFEPYFSTSIEYEDDDVLQSYGVSAHTSYDAVGRAYRTDYPDGTFTETIFTPWEIQSFDKNDTVDRSAYKAIREVQEDTSLEKIALTKAVKHKNTPAIVKYDPMGREVFLVEMNNNGQQRKTETTFDINGNPVSITDSRDLKAFEYTRDMQGRILYEMSIDAGEVWSFYDSQDLMLDTWDSKNIHQVTSYDMLNRVSQVHIDGALGLNQVVEKFIYGDSNVVANHKDKNLLGQLVTYYDQAGILSVEQYSPAGQPLSSSRELLDQFTQEPDWADIAAVGIAPDKYESKVEVDAFGRVQEQSLPDSTVRKYIYHRGGGISKVLVSTADGAWDEKEILKNSSYDSKGMRQKVLLGNDVNIDYTYDTQTFRMKRLHSSKKVGAQRTYQDINYTYDPVGNLVHFIDKTQEPAFSSTKVLEGLNISPHSEFEYDALYQLTNASGRVHQSLLQYDYKDRSRENGTPASWGKGTRHISLNNGAAVERYSREYKYDIAGNIESTKHSGTTENWVNKIWTSKTSNRSLPFHDLNGNEYSNPESRFDENGNCTSMPHLREIAWNYRNNISKVVVIDRKAEGKHDDIEYYVYGGDGQRIRKITQKVTDVAANKVEYTEKVYLDGCEIKKIKRDDSEILERLTSHISDGTNTIALVHHWQKDTLSLETDDITKKNIHYQLTNHLGSSSLELDEKGDVITYEEYFPFGGTSFIAGRSKRDIDLKNYRYSGKERDDFTGLYYFGYRYYAHWIGGWFSPDPLGPEDSVNLYLYVQNNPINLVDPNGLQSTNSGGVSVTQGTITRERWEGLTQEQQNAINRGDIVLNNGEILTNDELNRRIAAGDKFNLHIATGVSDIRQDPRWQEFRDAGISEELADSMVEFFQSIDEAMASLNLDEPIDSNGSESSGDVGGDSGNETSTGASGETADSSGTGNPEDTNNGATHDGVSGGTESQSNGGGGGGNTGDGTTGGSGTGTEGTGTGNGQSGTGTSGDASSGIGTGGTGNGGSGSGEGTRHGNQNGTGQGNNKNSSGNQGASARAGSKTGTGNGQVGGHPQGSPSGVEGGEVGGSEGGSPEGDINGRPDGTDPNGSRNGSATGTDSVGNGGEQGQQSNSNNPNNTGNPAQNSEQQNESGSNEEQRQQGSGQTNWMDTATKWAGYINLEFGNDEQGGEAGGVPGGMNLFNLDLPMWARRTIQAAYIVTAVVTVLVPIGKAAMAAKLALQGAIKVGLRATARRMLTSLAAKLPTRAGVRAGLQRVKSSISSVTARIRNRFSRRPLQSGGDPLRDVLGAARHSHPEEYAETMRRLSDAGVEIVERKGAMAYSPLRGRSGQLILDPDASIGALRHEALHYADDLANGMPGLGYYMQNPNVRWAMEFRSYMTEVKIARELRRFDVARELISLARAEKKLLLGI